MNIGEISKPSADRSQINKKLKVTEPSLVGEASEVSDRVEISKESFERYKHEESKRDKTLVKSEDEISDDDLLNKERQKIDFTA